ncbi:T cell receptor alpha chain, partial [Scophthalmus maximus]
MVLNLADRSVPLNTSSAALFRRDQTFFFAGFSNETIRSCDLLNTTARNQQIPSSVDSSDDSQPENVRLNSYLLLLNAARVVFTKTVAFSTVLTVSFDWAGGYFTLTNQQRATGRTGPRDSCTVTYISLRFWATATEEDHGIRRTNTRDVSLKEFTGDGFCHRVCHSVNNQGTGKLEFSSGTKVTVETEDDYEPSYYRLDNANHTVTACLATGFSKHNATLQHRLFRSDRTTTNSSTTRAVRISDDSVFSEVVLIQSDEGDSCELDKREARVCADTLDKDVTVNTMSLTVLVLRLLFIKTVVFNVLMTLRLWISH